MRVIRNIWLVFAVLLTSCIRDTYEIPGELEMSGLMAINVLETNGDAIDKIETVRFLVFKDPSGSPKLELNELFNIPAVSPGDGQVSKFEIILEVSHKPGIINEKIVVAIINEPSVMSNTLGGINNYNELMNLELSFADFLNNDHNNLQNGKTMPMTGAVRTTKIYATQAEAQSAPINIGVLRAVARVDVYIRKQVGTDFDLATGSGIILKNTYGKEYLVRNQDGPYTFGKIQTVTSGFISKSWSATGINTIPDLSSGNNGLLLCFFYTAERTCVAPGNADKLILEITALSSVAESRNAEVILDELNRNNVKTTIDNIERNNVYGVILTVTDKGLLITANVLDWNSQDIIVEF